jgi:hypothetical protein
MGRSARALFTGDVSVLMDHTVTNHLCPYRSPPHSYWTSWDLLSEPCSLHHRISLTSGAMISISWNRANRCLSVYITTHPPACHAQNFKIEHFFPSKGPITCYPAMQEGSYPCIFRLALWFPRLTGMNGNYSIYFLRTPRGPFLNTGDWGADPSPDCPIASEWIAFLHGEVWKHVQELRKNVKAFWTSCNSLDYVN